MRRIKPRIHERSGVTDLDRITVTYAVLTIALMVVNLAGYGLIAATV